VTIVREEIYSVRQLAALVVSPSAASKARKNDPEIRRFTRAAKMRKRPDLVANARTRKGKKVLVQNSSL
jgi:hypothetical protein